MKLRKLRNCTLVGISLLFIIVLFWGCKVIASVSKGEDELRGVGDKVLYLNIIWHNHQPLYGKDPKTGVYSRPWVRVHATKDYLDMPAMLEKYRNLRITFNLTPVLIRQLDDFVKGAKDKYWVLGEKPTASLTREDKRFILRRFFDANYKNIIGRYPRYEELLKKRGGSSPEAIDRALKRFSESDFRDLQVWFNLAWIDPGFLEKKPLRSLVEKGRNFSEADKRLLFREIQRLIRRVLPEYKKLQDEGIIEVITTPYAHPILPLIYNSDLAKIGDPGVKLPKRFSYPQDAIAQLKLSVEMYRQHFGRSPAGLWPAEGAVAQPIVRLVANAGYKWMASGEQVLARSIGLSSFSRNSAGLVNNPDALYRPYYVESKDGKRVGIVFRDNRLSDLIGFEYSGKPGRVAAADFVERLERIRKALLEGEREGRFKGPHLVSVILDGENAWEYYPNDGKEFLNSLYEMLSRSKDIKTVTVSDYLSMFPKQRVIKNLWPGAWFSPNYATWIGEPEENEAWDYLGKVRRHLAQFDMYKRRTTTPQRLKKAFDYMYLAEGSDWFWWFGSDQNSGDDEYFDRNFRFLLKQVYRALGDPIPDFLNVPIIPEKPIAATRPVNGILKPVVNGTVTPGEWENAALYRFNDKKLNALFCGFDEGNIYFRIDSSNNSLGSKEFDIYFSLPHERFSSPFTLPTGGQEEKAKRGVLGFRAGFVVRMYLSKVANNLPAGVELWGVGRYGNWKRQGIVKNVGFVKTGGVSIKSGGSNSAPVYGKNVLEIAVPITALGGEELEAGDSVNLQVAVVNRKYSNGSLGISLFPCDGPGRVMVPELGNSEVILSVRDPLYDDHGPGSYIYPTDGVFKKGVFDATSLVIAEDSRNLIFRFKIRGKLKNVWGSGINLSLQTFDVYIDRDPGKRTGSRMLLQGRNAALRDSDGWEYAIWVEGWEQKIFRADKTGRVTSLSGSSVRVIVNPGKRTVTIKVKKEVFGNKIDPARWGYVCAVLSQDGFPSPGVLRVRDIDKKPAQWRFGGAPDDTNHTRIIDLIWPADFTPTQEQILSSYPHSKKSIDSLGPKDFANIPLLTVARLKAK